MSGGDKRIATVGEEGLASYLKEISTIPLLSRMEEDSLARLAVKGDRQAREKLIQANLRFVVTVAKKFHSHGLALEDLIGEGNVGLIMAVEHFNPDKGYRFISYAVWWIRQTIMKAVGDRMIRLPQNKTQMLLQIAKVRELLQGERYLTSEAEMIAQKLHSDRESVTELLRIASELISLEAPVFSENDDSSSLAEFAEFIGDKSSSQPEVILMTSALRDDINSVMRSLPQKESEILKCRFGLNGKRPMTLKALGSKYKLTKERVRQIEKKAIKNLRRPSCRRLLEAYR